MSEQTDTSTTTAASANGNTTASSSATGEARAANQPFDITRYQDPRVIQRLLHTARTIAIVGLSSDPLRASHFVGFYLQRHGYRVVPVNPNETEVLGEKSYPSLAAIPFPVDVVDVFRRSEAVPEIAREAVQIGAKALWTQFGVISPEGARVAEQGGLDVVMDRCMKVEHARYMGKMHWYGLNTGVISSKRE